MYLIKPLVDIQQIQDKLDSIHTDLINADLRTYPSATTTAFGGVLYHPTEDLVCASFLSLHTDWDVHITTNVDQNDLVNLTEDWGI